MAERNMVNLTITMTREERKALKQLALDKDITVSALIRLWLQEQQKAEDTVKKQAYGKEQRKRRAEVRARIKAVENQIEELGAHIVELENEINDPEVLRDHLLLRDKCDELDDTRFHQQELYDEWEKLAEEQEAFEAEDA